MPIQLASKTHPLLNHGSTKPKPRSTSAQWVMAPNGRAKAMAAIVSNFDRDVGSVVCIRRSPIRPVTIPAMSIGVTIAVAIGMPIGLHINDLLNLTAVYDIHGHWVIFLNGDLASMAIGRGQT